MCSSGIKGGVRVDIDAAVEWKGGESGKWV